MKYSFKTEQFGIRGAIASVFADGVHVWDSPMVQSFGKLDDRGLAAVYARERISDLKVMEVAR